MELIWKSSSPFSREYEVEYSVELSPAYSPKTADHSDSDQPISFGQTPNNVIT